MMRTAPSNVEISTTLGVEYRCRADAKEQAVAAQDQDFFLDQQADDRLRL